jgi:hypothetical protein
VKDDIDLVKSIRKRYEEGDPKAVEMVRLMQKTQIALIKGDKKGH